MNKRKILSLVLALVMVLGLSVPASAAVVGLTPQAEKKLTQLLQNHGYSEEEIQEELTGWYDYDFTDGPQRFYDRDGGGSFWVNDQGEEVFQDLMAQGYVIYPFKDGYASIDQGLGTGYVNAVGEIIIPCQYGRCSGAGDTLAVHIHNGRVWVLKENYDRVKWEWEKPETEEPETWEVAQLDLAGNMVVPWTTVDAFADGLHMLNDSGYCGDCAVMEDATQPVTNPQPIDTWVAPSAWAKEEVEAAEALGIAYDLTGNPGYQDAITREQFAELVVQLLRATDPEVANFHFTPETPSFDDCPSGFVRIAASVGVVNGVGNNRFAPEQTTNREQIATMVTRAVHHLENVRGVDLTPAPASIENFGDKDQVSSWAVEGVGTLAANGIMNGTSATALSPKSSCTVEQSICLTYRVYKALQAAN